MTPPEVLAYRPAGSAPNSGGWWVRVVPNLYAASGSAMPSAPVRC
jgi:UDPglucose--hexose-1-phosphate uridylyltransferase